MGPVYPGAIAANRHGQKQGDFVLLPIFYAIRPEGDLPEFPANSNKP
jgi:hypothetical protein